MPFTKANADLAPLQGDAALTAQYRAAIAPRLPESIDLESIEFSAINDPATWEQANSSSLKNRAAWELVDAGTITKDPLPTILKQSLTELKNDPTAYLEKHDLRKAYKGKDCRDEQILDHIEFLLHQCLVAHNDFVAEHCMPKEIRKHIDEFDFFHQSDKAAYTRLDCLRAYAYWKKEINSNIKNTEDRKQLKHYLFHLMDHYYESANKKTFFDKCCTFATEVIPIVALGITIAAIVIAIMHPGAPIILVLSYLGYIGFTGSLASIFNHLRDGLFGGVWKSNRMLLLDLALTIVGVTLGFFPMVAHALGHHYHTVQLATRYINLILDLATSGVNFIKSLFLVRDKRAFYSRRDALPWIEAIKALPNAKISSWIIYTNLKLKKIMTDYYDWTKRLIHPARHHHELAKKTNILIFPHNEASINAAFEEQNLQFRLAQIACVASAVMLIALILISQPATLILGWGMMVLSISTGTVLSLINFYFHFSMRPSEKPARRLRGNLGIILGCLCIGLLITLPIAPVALSAIANLLYALTVISVISLSLVFVAQAIQKAYHHTQIKVGPKFEKGLRIMAQVAALSLCVIAAYVIVTIAMASCPYPLVISTLLSSSLAVLSWVFQKGSKLGALGDRSKLILRGISNMFAMASTGIAVYAVFSLAFPMLIPTLGQVILTISQAIASSLPVIGALTPSHIVFVTLGSLLTSLIALGALMGMVTPKNMANAPAKNETPVNLRDFLNGLAGLLKSNNWKPIHDNDPRLNAIEEVKKTVDTILNNSTNPQTINPKGSYAKRVTHVALSMFNAKHPKQEAHGIDVSAVAGAASIN